MSEIKVKVNGVTFGSENEVGLIAGPCAVESKEQLSIAAKAVKEAGLKILRASAYKPRTSPKDFQGLGKEGIDILAEVGEEFGLATESEILDPRDVLYASEKIDILRVGARNMQNFELLKEMNKVDNPIILKNGLASTYKEFISASNYLLENGKENVILCYRGIRSFENSTRFTTDMLSYKKLSEMTSQPIIFDPSHPAGDVNLIESISITAIAAGFEGLIVETHPDPKKALSDASQQIPCNKFKKYIENLKPIASALKKEIN
jgi:3-deoxy-7-phosphoheptulonate synthase